MQSFSIKRSIHKQCEDISLSFFFFFFYFEGFSSWNFHLLYVLSAAMFLRKILLGFGGIAYWGKKKKGCFRFQTYAHVCNIHGVFGLHQTKNYSGHKVSASQIGCYCCRSDVILWIMERNWSFVSNTQQEGCQVVVMYAAIKGFQTKLMYQPPACCTKIDGMLIPWSSRRVKLAGHRGWCKVTRWWRTQEGWLLARSMRAQCGDLASRERRSWQVIGGAHSDSLHGLLR